MVFLCEFTRSPGDFMALPEGIIPGDGDFIDGW